MMLDKSKFLEWLKKKQTEVHNDAVENKMFNNAKEPSDYWKGRTALISELLAELETYQEIKKPLLCKLGWHDWQRGRGAQHFIKYCSKCDAADNISSMEIGLGVWD